MQKTKNNRSGFTLLELLIVIGLMAALVALILPRLTADREEAIGAVCDYNQAGTLRVLTQYEQMFGKYPADLHNGLKDTTATAVAMDGIPDAQATNMVGQIATTRHALSTNEAASLVAAGIESICSGTGLNSTPVATGVNVARCTTTWLDDTPAPYTFDGMDIAAWQAGTATPGWDTANGAGIVVCLWVAPTTDWTSGSGDNSDWTKGVVNYGIDLEGQCPVPVHALNGIDAPDFAYYMAYIKAYANGAAARMIGTSCPECGVLNP